jgi:hypothetical protein
MIKAPAAIIKKPLTPNDSYSRGCKAVMLNGMRKAVVGEDVQKFVVAPNMV